MSMRLVAAVKGLAVGVLTLWLSVVGAYACFISRSHRCAGFGADPACSARESRILLSVLFGLMLVVGPLLAWGFLLALPGCYVIPPLLVAFVDVLVLPQHVGPLTQHSNFIFYLAPVAAYPVVAALSVGRRRMSPAPAPSPGIPVTRVGV